MEKKSSPKYWKASHQLLIHWFPNFNNTQHFYIVKRACLLTESVEISMANKASQEYNIRER